MTRSKNRARKKDLGYPTKNFKSKTSDCFLNGRLRRDEKTKIGKDYPRRHTGRTELKASLAAKFGVPEDTTFIFRDRAEERPEGPYLENLKLNFGTTVIIDRKDSSLVLAVRCNEFKKMPAEERESFRFGISTPFLHARARNVNDLHNSIQLLILALIYWGWMGCCGWRGGSDDGKKFGPYSLKDFSVNGLVNLEEDQQRMTNFHKVRDFWAERFSSLSLSTFESNVKLATEAKIPGFHDLEWQKSDSGQVFASNLVVTCYGFNNTEHIDKHDYTRYSYGMFSLIDAATGEPHQLEGSARKGKIQGASFIVKDFGIEVDFSGCDGVVEMVWDTRIPHHSTPSTALDANGKRVLHYNCEVTRFGSSCQISTSLVKRIQMVESEKGKMTEEEWEIYVKKEVKTYEEMCKEKLTQFEKLCALRADKQLVRAAKKEKLKKKTKEKKASKSKKGS